jgi:hypothetical protein
MTDTERRPLLAQDQNVEAGVPIRPSYTNPDGNVEAATDSNPTSEASSGKSQVHMVTIVSDTSVACQGAG